MQQELERNEAGELDYRVLIAASIRQQEKLLGWFLALNGFLFAAVATVWQNEVSGAVYVLTAFGTVACLLWFGAGLVHDHYRTIRDYYRRPEHVAARGVRLVPLALQLLDPRRMLPGLLACTWFALLLVRIAQ
jgi:hypothetical protein